MTAASIGSKRNTFLFYKLEKLFLALNFLYHVNSLCVTVAVKGSAQENVGKLYCGSFVNNSAAHTDYVGVVMAAGHLSAKLVGNGGSSYAFNLICDNADAYSRTAADNALFALALGYCLGSLIGIFGVINAVGCIGAEVLILNILFL